MKFRSTTAIISAAAIAASMASAQEQDGEFVPVTDEMLQNPDPADWLMWRRTLDSWGYSPLDQITPENVDELDLVWSRGLAPGIQEGTPLVYDGIMYMVQPMDVIQALDATTGDLIWEYRRDLPDDLVVPFPAINRNIAIYDDLIIDTSADDYVFALDAKTGQLVWENQILDYRTVPAQETSGPIIADGKIISGRGCEPVAGPEACVVTAHDALTGEELWRTRTIPAPGEPGDETWGDVPFESRWHVGTWMVPSYDPELNRIYVGTSVTSPAPKFLLGGNENEHLYHNSTLALNADTGEIEWYFQHVVDHWDLDHPFERLLIDTAVTPNPDEVEWISPNLTPGEERKVVTGIPGKTGIVYTLDRETGEFLWATPTVEQNVISDIDEETGEATVPPEMVYTAPGQEMLVCPSTSGGKIWAAGSYSPETGLMYFPLNNTCMETVSVLEEPSLENLYGIRNQAIITPGEENVGTVRAIDVETGETAWTHEQRAGTMSLVATGGGLVFGGDVNGRFRALEATSGDVLWETILGSHVTGYPVSYAVDGKQYVAVSTGTSLTSGGLNALTPELHPSTSNILYVFALEEDEG